MLAFCLVMASCGGNDDEPETQETAPRLSVDLTPVSLFAFDGETDTVAITVSGSNLAGDIYLTLVGNDALMFRVSSDFVDKSIGEKEIFVAYTRYAGGNHTAMLIIESFGAEALKVPLHGSLPQVKGHEYMDLCLPSGVKWATCNVGALSPGDFGDYFAWGQTYDKSCYAPWNIITDDKNSEEISGNPNKDAATANWGGSWRMPSDAEINELIENCNWAWTDSGYNVTSKINDKRSIFLPAAGYRVGTSSYVGIDGRYWSSTPEGNDTLALGLYFSSKEIKRAKFARYYGRSVRPVSD